jgi:hypothetical protein
MRKTQADPPHLHPGHRSPHAVPLAGQCPGAAELHGAGGIDLRRGFDQELPPAPSLQTSDSVSEKARQPASFAQAVENFERELIIDSLKRTRATRPRPRTCWTSSLQDHQLQDRQAQHQPEASSSSAKQ